MQEGKKRIALITNHYPFYPGEQFVETEIKYWNRVSDFDVFVLPWAISEEVRSIPENISLDLSLATRSKLTKLRGYVCALFSNLFYQELYRLHLDKNISIITLLMLASGLAKTYETKHRLKSFCKKNGPIYIAYFYWNDFQSYGGCLLKKKNLIQKVVSRVHGYDLYEELKQKQYMPIKRSLISKFDKIYTLSSLAKNYLIEIYGAEDKKIEVSPLGVTIPENVSSVSGPEVICLLSVSYCVSVKRLDKIIDTLNRVSSEVPFRLNWVHIGGGVLLDQLKSLALDRLGGMENINFQFLGELTNIKVLEFYEQNNVDIFINTSESEGLPVSIMEAMSFGVPVIAPNVGAIGALVGDDCGKLMTSNPSISEISKDLVCMIYNCKKPSIRKNARKKIEKFHNAENNYSLFINSFKLL